MIYACDLYDELKSMMKPYRWIVTCSPMKSADIYLFVFKNTGTGWSYGYSVTAIELRSVNMSCHDYAKMIAEDIKHRHSIKTKGEEF